MYTPASIFLKKTANLQPVSLILPGSKSESNRALIIRALGGSGGHMSNVSSARDTQTMMELLGSTSTDQNVLDAGTTMRFLTAYYAATGKERILRGTDRMHQRPISILVEALNEIGCNVNYLGEPGFPPLSIGPYEQQLKKEIAVPGDVSSQYISALLMIAPAMPEGLTVEVTGQLGSKPYVDMTLSILKSYGIAYEWNENRISIPNQAFQQADFTVESDWSGVSYWFSFVTLANQSELHLRHFRRDSFQGDSVISDIMTSLGVDTQFSPNGLTLKKTESIPEEFEFDFSPCPDLAQTVAVTCAAKNIPATFTGLQSLRIKETDRIQALQNELSKIGCDLTEYTPGVFKLMPGPELPESAEIETYEDHRMAMAFAPLSTKMDLIIKDPEVVNKSYPSFWDDVKSAGVEIS